MRALGVAAVLWSSGAWACAVCGQGSGEDQSAYLAMTGVMSLLPLGMLGGVIFWVARSVRKADQLEQLEQAQQVASTTAATPSARD